MRGKRSTFCISSQVGCAMGCTFCATGKLGLHRNLSAGEILGQVVELCRANGNETGNVVFMGMGEPLANLGSVTASLKALTDEKRFAIGARRLTVSTVGIVKGISDLALLDSPPNLALSLNSPFAPLRASIMPVTNHQRLDDVVAACADYYEKTGRRVLIEYVVLGEVNTDYEHARGLLRIARKLGGIVNLIPYNPVDGGEFKQPKREEIQRIKEVLEGAGMNVTERYRRGRDIAAACGQLAGEGQGGGNAE
jgi:23S rRNA (adenine2503-C2)-methyltransferase